MIICSLYILACVHQIFKILVAILLIRGGIMGGRHKIFEDPITWTRDTRKTKFDLFGFFWPPFRRHLRGGRVVNFLKEEEEEATSQIPSSRLVSYIWIKLKVWAYILLAWDYEAVWVFILRSPKHRSPAHRRSNYRSSQANTDLWQSWAFRRSQPRNIRSKMMIRVTNFSVRV